MKPIDPIQARAFAVDVVKQLRGAGHEALWAGGCVRDQLLGREPKDYDVATDAVPEAVQAIFGRRRTLPIGASFGVVTVLGPKSAGQIEVATFRRDAEYSDGRHPDSVTFSTAEEDARRRDFTINGAFFDPLSNEVIDYVGARQDLKNRVVRAIGDANERIREDKLRMLRAVRFAATFDFAIEQQTLGAVRRHAAEISVVSPERIAAELRRMLVHSGRHVAWKLLNETMLLDQIMPEAAETWPDRGPAGEPWHQTIRILAALGHPTFTVALAVVLRDTHGRDTHGRGADGVVSEAGKRWRLSNDERDGASFLLAHEQIIRQAKQQPWPVLQRVLILPRIDELLTYSEAVATVVDRTREQVEFCRDELARPADQLNPRPLVTGADLKSIGLSPGPAYKTVLERVRDAQLLGDVSSSEEAIEMARHISDSLS